MARTIIASTLGLVSSPLVAGPLLYILSRGPESETRNKLVDFIKALPFKVEVNTVVKALKYLIAFNVVGRLNSYLNAISQNSWTLRAPTAQWKWNEQIALVTGGASGIGEQTVLRLVRKGIKVVVLDIVPLGPSLKDYADVYYYKTDITDAKAVQEVADEIKAKVGTVTILINNAGIGASKYIIDTTPEFLQKIFGVNLFSHFYTVRAILPDMIKLNRGHIVTIASTASFVTIPSIVDYAATKAGVLSFHEGLKREIINAHKAPGVFTTVVHPNWTRTGLIAKEADAIEKQQGALLTPEAVADAITGQIFSCRGGQLILPSSMTPISTVKAWPNWLQEAFRGILSAGAINELQ